MTTSSHPSRIEWVGQSCALLRAIAAEFETTLPFKGLTIGTAIHLEPKTIALLMTLRAGGAQLVATGNLNSTQPATVDYLKRQGITVIGGQTTDATDPFRLHRRPARSPARPTARQWRRPFRSCCRTALRDIARWYRGDHFRPDPVWSRCATPSACRCLSSTTAPSSSLPRTAMRSARACSKATCASPIARPMASV